MLRWRNEPASSSETHAGTTCATCSRCCGNSETLPRGVVAALIEIDQRQALPVLQRLLAGHMLNLGWAQLNPDLTLNFLKVLAQMGERAGLLPVHEES